jgi:hypothetical protein
MGNVTAWAGPHPRKWSLGTLSAQPFGLLHVPWMVHARGQPLDLPTGHLGHKPVLAPDGENETWKDLFVGQDWTTVPPFL